MADYSEFPTTPTAWQEQQWQMVQPLETEDRPAPEPRRRVDLVALVPGVLFVVLALSAMVGAVLPFTLLDDGTLLWVFLIGAGVALLVRELRKPRSRG
ncbi:hypothetical protein E9549_06575 [Blastococcus sp. MG754426]|uniref:hypothetical protein n=1 Tax=unclassified Blastococcus TaxID=2619396 RepID=UPI001EEFB981|nr:MULTISPECIES: hypothetical protein [unclassified Blastococcus]MCF6507067.1 hypothetical protein [Blastococcus sp. MG754426]MCF6511804.1 hypothetical protein [Blastococcus sp. MG754427]MCF6734735.1 hypothetical protein [Blastococcus sp. KM273129]